MDTPLLQGIRKQAGFGSAISWGMRALSRNPRAGTAALGGLIGGGVGLATGGDFKSTMAGAGLGAAGGYGAGAMGLDASKMWRNARGRFQGMRRAMRAPVPPA